MRSGSHDRKDGISHCQASFTSRFETRFDQNVSMKRLFNKSAAISVKAELVNKSSILITMDFYRVLFDLVRLVIQIFNPWKTKKLA